MQDVMDEIAGNDPLVPSNIPPFEWPAELLCHGMIPCVTCVITTPVKIF